MGSLHILHDCMASKYKPQEAQLIGLRTVVQECPQDCRNSSITFQCLCCVPW